MKIRELEEGLGSWLAGKLGKAPAPVKAATTPLRTVSKTWPWTQGIAQAEKQGIKFVPLTAQGDLVVDIAGRPIVVVDMGGGRSMPFYVSTVGWGQSGCACGTVVSFLWHTSHGLVQQGLDRSTDQ